MHTADDGSSRLPQCAAFVEALLQSIPTPVFYKDRQGRYIGCNRAFSEQMGVTSEEIAGKTVFELWPDEMAAVYHRKDLELMERPVHQQYEFTVRDRHGEQREVIFAKDVFYDERGEVAGLVGAYIDISERIQAEQALRASENRYRELVSLAVDGILLGDPDATIIEANDAFCALTGLAREAVIGMPIGGLPWDRDSLQRNPFRFDLVNAGETVTTERSLHHADGTRVDIEMRSKRMPDGCYQSIFRDITARKRAEQELLLFKELVDSSSDAIGMSTPQGRHFYQNRTFDAFFGDIGDNPPETLYCDPITGHAVFKTIMAGGQWDGEVEMHGHDGSRRRILLRAYASSDQTGRMTGLVGVHTDITERRILEERLRHAEKLDAIGQLAGGVAHDFNNQLQAILAHADQLAAHLPDGSDRHSAATIVAAAERSAALTGQLLAFSRKSPLRRGPLAIHALIEDIVALLGRSIHPRIRLQCAFHAAHDRVLGDASLLENAILNLALNARDAMPDGGTLSFTTANDERGEKLVITVDDTGCGMDAEIQRHLFEPFFTTKPIGKGTGMGLASAFGTIKQHQGSLTVESGPGSGTTVTIRLPLTAATDVQVDGCPDIMPTPRALTVLIIDDEPMICSLLQSMLESCGHRVLRAGDGRAGLETYRAHAEAIDLVILDMLMPVMDGQQVLAALQAHDPDLTVILSSGFSDQQDPIRPDSDRVLILDKPYRRQDLLSAIAALFPDKAAGD